MGLILVLGITFGSLAAVFWPSPDRDRKTFAERWEDAEVWCENFRERRKTASRVRQSRDVSLVGVADYLDGGSIGYVFTNQLGSFTVFLPHPFMRDDWDGEKMEWKVTDQQMFVGPPSAGEDGIEVKTGSGIERKLKTLAGTARAAATDAERRMHLDRFLQALDTREFDWSSRRN